MTADLSLSDLECLAWVAEGRASQVPDAAAARLTQAGLMRKPERTGPGTAALELTPEGLAHVRSSDQ
jgi:hypothetical protein